MSRATRRTFITSGIAVPLLASAGAFGATPDKPAQGKPGAADGIATADAPPPVTHMLARDVLGGQYNDIPVNVRREGIRTLFNYVGVAVGGSGHETVRVAMAALQPFSGPPQASILGRRERFDIMNAAFINGVSSHIFDYDDTHLMTIIHPGGVVTSAILALAESTFQLPANASPAISTDLVINCLTFIPVDL